MDDLIKSALAGVGIGLLAYFVIPKQYSAFKASTTGVHHATKHQHIHRTHTTGRPDEGNILMAQGEALGPKFGS